MRYKINAKKFILVANVSLALTTKLCLGRVLNHILRRKAENFFFKCHTLALSYLCAFVYQIFPTKTAFRHSSLSSELTTWLSYLPFHEVLPTTSQGDPPWVW